MTAVGIAVFIRILWAGFLWLTAAGNASKAGDAKNKIQSAVIGAILLFAAYLILYIINPDLVKNTFNFSIPPSGQTSTPPAPAPATGPTPGSGSLTGVPEEVATFGYHLGLPVARAQGIFFFTIRVTDASGDSYDQDYSMEILANSALLGQKIGAKNALAGRSHYRRDIARAAVNPSLQIITPFVPDGVIGRPYFSEIVVDGGQQPYSFSVVQSTASLGGNIAQAATGNGLPLGLSLQNTLELPIFRIENLTGTRDPSVFNSTDRFRLTLSSAKPNSTMFIKWLKNNSPWFYPGKTPNSAGWTAFAITDGTGTWINESNFTSNEIGNWQEWALVDGKISNAIGFVVIDPLRRNPTATCTQPSVGACPTGQCWTGHMDTTQNPSVPICSVSGQLPTGGTTGGAAGGSVGTAGTAGFGGGLCTGFGTGPGQVDFTAEFASCRDQINTLRNDAGVVNVTDTTSLPSCGSPGLEPGDPCLSLGRTLDGRPTRTIQCIFRDQRLAAQCGAPGSGGFCIPQFGQAQGNSFCNQP